MDDESYISEGAGVALLQEGGGGGGGPATNIRLYLRAAKLPKSMLTHQQPDVVARVSLLAPTARGGSGDGGGGGSPPPSPPRMAGAAHRRYGSSRGLPSPMMPPPPPSPNDDDGVSVGSVRSGGVGGGGEVGDLVDETEVRRCGTSACPADDENDVLPPMMSDGKIIRYTHAASSVYIHVTALGRSQVLESEMDDHLRLAIRVRYAAPLLRGRVRRERRRRRRRERRRRGERDPRPGGDEIDRQGGIRRQGRFGYSE